MEMTQDEKRLRIQANRDRALALRAKAAAAEANKAPASSSSTSRVKVVPASSVVVQQHAGGAKPCVSTYLDTFRNDNKHQSSDKPGAKMGWKNKNAYKRGGKGGQGGQAGVGVAAAARSVSGAPAAAPAPITCSLNLLTLRRFEVVACYHTDLIDLCKSMPSRQFDQKTKRWCFDLSDYKPFLKKSREIRSIKLKALPSSVLAAFAKEINPPKVGVADSGAKVDAPSSQPPPQQQLMENSAKVLGEYIDGKLMPFQREGIEFGLSRHGRVLIGDDMGLGKTLQAICLALFYRDEWPLLIVCPSSVRFTWKQQLQDWMQDDINPDYINVVTTGKQNCTEGLVNVISYDLMARLGDALLSKQFNIIIMNSRRVILLSGTPALSRPNELYVQISAINGKVFSNFHDFGMRYCDGKQSTFGWDFNGYSNLHELQLLLEKTVLIRRLKSEVLQQLPPKTRKVIRLNPEYIKTSKRLETLKKNVKEGSTCHTAEEMHTFLMQYYFLTGVLKTKAVSEYILELLESNDEKILLFMHHQKMMDDMQEIIVKKDIKFMRIDGKTASVDRANNCTRFQSDPSVRVALLSITAANAGIHLTAASVVVFAELYWNPGTMLQAEDRTHRIGQKNCVNIHYLIAAGTSDDYMWPLIQKKLKVLEKVGLSKEVFIEDDAHEEMQEVNDPKQRKLKDFLDNDKVNTDLYDFLDGIDLDEFQSEIPPQKKAKH